MSESEVVVFRTVRSPMEARILGAILKGAGIPVYVSGQNLQDEFALSQMVLGTVGVTVEIPRASLADAEQVLAEARAAGAALAEQTAEGPPTEVVPASEWARVLLRLFELDAETVTRNTEGVTRDESFRQPPGGGSHLHWVLGHMIATRRHILGMLDAKHPWSEAEFERYGRGSSPKEGSADAPDLAQLLADFETTQKLLAAQLAAVTAERLAEPAPPDNPFGAQTIGELIHIFQFHEAYHCGQLGILRRFAGHEGAI